MTGKIKERNVESKEKAPVPPKVNKEYTIILRDGKKLKAASWGECPEAVSKAGYVWPKDLSALYPTESGGTT
mgnify:CR=1 FL=1